MNKKNYYETLEINRNANAEEIKKVYRKLAAKWHPDKWANKSPQERQEATKKMQEINEAYDVLGDEQKKKTYDLYGQSSSEATGFNPQDFGGFGGNSSIFDDIFDIFTGGRHSSRTTTKKTGEISQKGEDILLNISLSFKESILGTSKKVILELERSCVSCKQTGAYSPNDIKECSNCHGQGVVSMVQQTVLGNIRTQTTCSLCRGRCRIITRKCENCSGRKFIKKRETVQIDFPRGIQPGKRLRMKCLGNDGWYGGERGDIYIETDIKKHRYFQRKDNDIYVSVPISFLDAILGNSVEVITIEGIEKIKIPAGSQNGDHLVLKNRGCYLGVGNYSRGDFYIWLQVMLPKKVKPKTREILEKIEKDTDWHPNQDFIIKNKDIIEN